MGILNDNDWQSIKLDDLLEIHYSDGKVLLGNIQKVQSIGTYKNKIQQAFENQQYQVAEILLKKISALEASEYYLHWQRFKLYKQQNDLDNSFNQLTKARNYANDKQKKVIDQEILAIRYEKNQLTILLEPLPDQ